MKQHRQDYCSRRSSPASPHRTVGGALRWRWLTAVVGVLLLLVLGVRLTSLNAQDDEATAASRENRIKAAYLYQFGRYIEWPAKAFADSKSPFVIGVVGKDQIVADLDDLAKIKKIQDRPIKVKRFKAPGDVRGCHILFLSASLTAESQNEVIRRAFKQGVLLAGESPEFLDWGGAVRFVVEENKIRIYIARKAAQREGLVVSAKLLQVAHVVD